MNFDIRSNAALAGLISLATAIGACNARVSVAHPKFKDGGLLASSTPVKLEMLTRLDGMYTVSAGGHFGDLVAVHASPDAISIFAEPNASYAIMRAGCIDQGTRLVLEGHWRYAADTNTGLARLFVGPPDLVKQLCAGTAPPLGADRTPSILPALDGLTGVEDGDPGDTASFRYQKPLLASEGRFAVISHHGACRTIDDCGYAENSIESIVASTAFGGSIVEIDVHRTADDVPILFHDDTFGPRLANGPYCHGPIDQFTLAHVRAFCTLKYGEQVPTLEEALDAAESKTVLRGVWIDAKTPDVVAPTIDVMKRFFAKTAGNGRKMPVVIGLGESNILDAYKAANPPPGFPCLVELDPSDVRDNGCVAWGPRYTRGPMSADVKSLQDDGHVVAFWTMDEEEFIRLFLKSSPMPNGILSDRQGLVFWMFQTIATENTLPPTRASF
jgi:glycerophosphoryl diester phosphodiesterase